ncbi:MAG: hypothetical protein KJO82_04080 [Gammaproteobacteria bacterium]|nr:hypothetical protein [Gammaproteobacteria bacterium]
MKKHLYILSIVTLVMLAACGGSGDTTERLNEVIDDSTGEIRAPATEPSATRTEEQLQAGKDALPSADEVERRQGDELAHELRGKLGLGNSR